MKRLSRIASSLLVFTVPIIFFLTASCEKDGQVGDEDGVTVKDVKTKAGETLEVTQDFITGKMKDYKSEIDEIRARIDERIEELAQEAKQAKEEARKDIQANMDKLRRKMKSLEGKYEKLENASGKAWEDLTSGFESALAELKKANE